MADVLFIMPGEQGGIPVLPDQYGRWGIFQRRPLPGTPPIVAGPQPTTPAPTAKDLPPPPEVVRARPGWCLGAEDVICGPAGGGVPIFGSFGGPRSNDVCRAAANVTCLAVGLFVLFALLGLSINALLRD